MSGWSGIEEFIAVAVGGTFVGAARTLGASTSHMSRAIALLEKRLGVTLFVRTTRSVQLTEVGRTFLESCERLIRERDEAIARVGSRGEPQGELRLTCSTSMGERFVVPIVRQFMVRNPALSVNLELTNRVIDLIAEGFDLGIRTGSLPDSRLIRTKVATRAFYTCAAPDYLREHSAPQVVGDLRRHECLVGTSTLWRFFADGHEITHRPRSRWRCNSGSGTLDAALAGLGVCQLPEFYVLPHLSDGTLVEVLSDLRPPEESIWAIYPQRRHALPKVDHLIELLRDQLPQLLHRGLGVP